MEYFIISTILFAILIDGIKLIIESYGKIHTNKGYRSPDETTVVMAAYNEPNILRTIETLLSESNTIIIVNDCSSDETGTILESLGNISSREQTQNGELVTIKRDKHLFKIHHNDKNRGKVQSIHIGSDYVETDYIFTCDADIYLGDDFEMPISLMSDEVDAISFCVLPFHEFKKTTWKWLLYKLQYHEYQKSMQIGRQFATSSKSVECISGAAGLFKIDRFRNLLPSHTTVWQGEDLERTLLELLSDGNVIYSPNIVYTDVPLSLKSISKQRVFGWWGGLYRNLNRMIKLMIRKQSPLRLKFEMFYNLISVLIDPFKFLSLWVVILNFNIITLLILYFIYLLFELFIGTRIKHRSVETDNPVVLPWLIFYPVYGMLQLHYRLLGGLYILFKFIKERINKFAFTFVLILLTSQFLTLEAQNINTTSTYSQYNLSNSETWDSNYNIGIYSNGYYGVFNYGLYNQLNIGTYVNKFRLDLGLRKGSVSPTIVYSRWFGNNFIRGNMRYSHNNDSYFNSTRVGIEYGNYDETHEIIKFTTSIHKRLDSNIPFSMSIKLNQPITSNIIWGNSVSFDINPDYSIGTSLTFYKIYIYSNYYNNFEYTDQEFLEFGIGTSLSL